MKGISISKVLETLVFILTVPFSVLIVATGFFLDKVLFKNEVASWQLFINTIDSTFGFSLVLFVDVVLMFIVIFALILIVGMFNPNPESKIVAPLVSILMLGLVIISTSLVERYFVPVLFGIDSPYIPCPINNIGDIFKGCNHFDGLLLSDAINHLGNSLATLGVSRSIASLMSKVIYWGTLISTLDGCINFYKRFSKKRERNTG